jgi:hypothetical protein
MLDLPRVRFLVGWMNLSLQVKRRRPREKRCLSGCLGSEPVRQREKHLKLSKMMRAGWIGCVRRRE